MTKETDTIEEYKELEVVNIRLVKEPSIISEKPISNANDAVNLIQNLIKDFDREAFCTLNLAADGKPISMNMVSIGTLTSALVRQIEDFMLELGRGFMFVGTQQRVTLNNTHYYVDMVFYNKELHAYVLIELKKVKLMTEAAGQLNMYLNYYAAEVNEPGDNPPIGIILCTDKDNVSAEYALGGLSNNIFASTYTYVIPEKEKLIAQVEAVLEKWEDKEE